jgi:hypothetical protein
MKSIQIEIDRGFITTYTLRLGCCSGAGRTESEARDNLELALINFNIINSDLKTEERENLLYGKRRNN